MVELSTEAQQLKALSTLQKFRVLDALHDGYEIKNLSDYGVTPEDRGTLSIVQLMKKYSIFDNKFIVAICEAVESFDVEQMEDAATDYEKKYTNDAGYQFIKNQIKKETKSC